MWVSNIRLNWRGSVSSPPHSGQRSSASGSAPSARQLAQMVLAPAALARAEALDEGVGEAFEVS